jgi:hypothetical protein
MTHSVKLAFELLQILGFYHFSAERALVFNFHPVFNAMRVEVVPDVAA